MATKTTEESFNYSFGDWKERIEPRINFIVKVYCILTAEAFISTFACLISITNDWVYEFQSQNIWITLVLAILLVFVNILAVYHDDPFRGGLFSYLILFSYSFAQGYVVSHLCMATNPRLILMIVFMSFTFIFALMMFYAISRKEFGTFGAIFFCSVVSMLLFFVFMYISDNSFGVIMLGSLWTVLLGMYIIYDTLLILGNKEIIIMQNDVVLTSFYFYTDIFLIFFSMFQIFRDLKEDDKHNSNTRDC